MNKFGVVVTELIREEYPTLFQGDPAAMSAVAVPLADILGGILAAAKVHCGETAYATILQTIIIRIKNMQDKTVIKVEQIFQERKKEAI